MAQDYNLHEQEMNMVGEPSSWGGKWTEEKLDAFEKYVKAYLTIMNAYRDKYQWKLVYFDGFAGSGSRQEDKSEQDDLAVMQDLFNDSMLQQDELNVYKGAAERVLSIPQRGFDFYCFVDKDPESGKRLNERLNPYRPGKTFEVRVSDANEQIARLVAAMRKNRSLASLVLLDPFGMQVDWHTIEMLKGTHTDLWILIPTGVIVNRLIDRKAKLPLINKLKEFFGKDENFLRDYFYEKKVEQTLFGEIETINKVQKPIQRIAQLYIDQLKVIFKYVTPKPLVMYNTRHTPIFHFACASNNEAAVKIASQIIDKKQRL